MALRSNCLNTQGDASSKTGPFGIDVPTHTDGKPTGAKVSRKMHLATVRLTPTCRLCQFSVGFFFLTFRLNLCPSFIICPFVYMKPLLR